MQYTFSRQQRLRSSHDFDRVYALKRRFSDSRLLVFAAVNGLNQTRIGLSVSRKQGSAVKRFRIKRLLREAFRLSQHELPIGYDLILIPRVGVDAGVDDFRESLVSLVGKAARQLKN
ncbi:MAG: ribonuclease P protein component [Planctomycetota bacterium]|nr:ribonuclease P protein component [Planctomycetota bacterium]MDA1213325.1 ribonuclease P protein component [Planctomycetota bacterium]